MSSFASPKRETDMHAQATVSAGGGNIFKAKESVLSKEGMKYLPGSYAGNN